MAKLLDDYGRKLPFSLQAEQSVLGSILINPAVFDKLPAVLSASDFYLEEHREIYGAMRDLFIASRSIDHVTLTEALVGTGLYATNDESTNYIKTLLEALPSASNIMDYATIVANKSKLRRLIEICAEVQEEAYSESDEASKIIGAAEQKIFELAQDSTSREFVHISDLLNISLKDLEKVYMNGECAQGTKTGFATLDEKIVGMGQTDLVLVGARPGMGKTSFAMNIATSVAQKNNFNVCVFSLEMSGEQIVQRMLSSEALVDSKAMREGKLKPDEWQKLLESATILSKCNIYVDDTPGITVTGMKAKLRRMKNVGLVVVDYLGLMQSDKKTDNRVQEVADISRNLKLMAKEFGTPIIACAQLSRGPESRTDKRPMLSDLRDSGAIEQDADIVIFLYREEYYKNDDNSQSTAEVIVAKNRHGETGNVKVGWMGKYTKFRSLDPHEEGQ